MEINDIDLIVDEKVLEKYPLPWHISEDKEKLSGVEDMPRSIMIRSANNESVIVGLFWDLKAREELKTVFDFIVTLINREKENLTSRSNQKEIAAFREGDSHFVNIGGVKYPIEVDKSLKPGEWYIRGKGK